MLLAAGLDGIEKGLDAGDPTPSSTSTSPTPERAELGSSTLPANLLDATRELERDDVIRAALGDDARRGLRRLLRPLQAARDQQAHEQITQWELDRYLQLY